MMKRHFHVALLAVVSVLAGCSASPASTGAIVPTKGAEPSGTYRIEGSADFTWVKMQGGQYGLWRAGDACNKDYSKAPASCLSTGTYQINEAQAVILFVDDATGAEIVSPFQVTAAELASDGSVQPQNTGGSSGGSSGNGQKPVATAMNLRKCFSMLVQACNLYFGTPENLPEPVEPPVIELPMKSDKQTATG